jgi:hypothetical protein
MLVVRLQVRRLPLHVVFPALRISALPEAKRIYARYWTHNDKGLVRVVEARDGPGSSAFSTSVRPWVLLRIAGPEEGGLPWLRKSSRKDMLLKSSSVCSAVSRILLSYSIR